jgi:hypothetical protein
MYGTVMIARSTADPAAMREMLATWTEAIGRDAGYVDQRVLRTDDGMIVGCVRFRDEAAYKALADNPAQDVWWRDNMLPLLDGEPQWFDGQWHDM